MTDDSTDPLEGDVQWEPAKSLWLGAMTASAVAFCPLYFSWGALFLFIATSAITGGVDRAG